MNYEYGGVYIPNLANTGEQYGIGQYRFAHNFELVGRKFDLVADQGHTLYFPDRENAVLDSKGCCWEALKLAPDLYFVRLGEAFAALDTGKRLATLLPAGGGAPVFAALKCPDCASGPLPEERHAPAGDAMVGTHVRWIFGVNRYVDHAYFAPGKVRSAWSKNTVRAGLNRYTFREQWEPAEAAYTEEPLTAVAIGGPYYLVDVACKIPEGVCAPAGINRLVLLEDYDRMMTVGCAVGPGLAPILLTGYAQFRD